MTDRQCFFRVFRYVKPYGLAYGIGTFLYCAQQFAFPFMTSIFMGGVTVGIMALSYSKVLDAILIMVVMTIGLVVLIGTGAYFYIVNTCYATRDLSLDVFRTYIKSSAESQRHSGEGVAAINTDINVATNIISNSFTPFLTNAIAASFSVVAVIVIDWRMGLGALVVGLLAFLVQSRFAASIARLGKEQLETSAESVKSLSNLFAGALTIRAYNRQDRSFLQFDRENGKLKKLAFKQALIGMWQDLFTTVQGWFTLVLVFALGGWLVVIGEVDFALIMMVLPLVTAISSAMSQIGVTFAGLQPPIVAARRVFDIIDATPEVGMTHGGTTANWDGKYGISIKELSFSYQGAGGEALSGIDLSIGENEMVAFVGESGSGKSTLLRLLIGMYEREGLNMEIGGVVFDVGSIGEWRSHFAYVDQSCKLFDMSIAENIAMGRQGEASEAIIQEAARGAAAHDFISELPDGYDTACGEKGASLSGGQKQRIAIARALVRAAPVLVFDEATSALDKDTERQIMDTINALRSNHTVLLTTHNLENAVDADKIVVLDSGRIAEMGTHQELLSKGGLYRRLYTGTESIDKTQAVCNTENTR